jgi:hypothetical protein
MHSQVNLYCQASESEAISDQSAGFLFFLVLLLALHAHFTAVDAKKKDPLKVGIGVRRGVSKGVASHP